MPETDLPNSFDISSPQIQTCLLSDGLGVNLELHNLLEFTRVMREVGLSDNLVYILSHFSGQCGHQARAVIWFLVIVSIFKAVC